MYEYVILRKQILLIRFHKSNNINWKYRVGYLSTDILEDLFYFGSERL